MASPYAPGIMFSVGDNIKGYEVIQDLDPGSLAFTGIAKTKKGRKVFLKKYKTPTYLLDWYDGYIRYQDKLKNKIESSHNAKALCYEMIEFFEMRDPTSKSKRAYYQVFEFIEKGMDLKKVISSLRSKSPDYDWHQRVMFAKMMVSGVNNLHEAGVIHADLKPENLFLVPDPELAIKYKLRVIDLDNSLIDGEKAPWHEYKKINNEGYVGSPYYYSPEHLNGKVPTKKSDVFTLGVILSELLGSGHPALGKDYDEVASGKKGSFHHVKIEKVIDSVDSVLLEKLINSCLEIQPDKRPTADKLKQVLIGELDSREIPLKKIVDIKTVEPSIPIKLKSESEKANSDSQKVPKKKLALKSESGKIFNVKAPFVYGISHFREFGSDFQKFFSEKQFILTLDDSGNWLISHHPDAINQTNLNNSILTKESALINGMKISLGKTGKCILVVELQG